MLPLPQVETVGYYSRDYNFNISKRQPSRLNNQGEIALSAPSRSKLLNRDITADDYKDEPQHEIYMQSLLFYIGIFKNLLEGIEFVTIRQVLAKVAAEKKCGRIMAFRKYGIIWISWYDEPKEQSDEDEEVQDNLKPVGRGLARGRAFSKTIVVANECNTEFQKVVNQISLPISGELDGSVLYSAETDARRQKKFESVEIKATTYSFENFLEQRSQYCFWQCYFGNVKALIVGKLSRVTDENVIYRIEQLIHHTPETLLKAMEKHLFQRSNDVVNEGMARVGNLLKALRRLLKEEGDAKVLKQEWIDNVAQWVEDTGAKFDQEFIKQVVTQMENKSNQFFNFSNFF